LGYAVAGSDTGHEGGDLKFGLGYTEKIEDWAWRAVHVMTDAAKLVLRSYYGRFAAHAYFSGCSTGGQQAFTEAHRFPDDYDGILAGAPGNNRVRLKVGFLWSWLAANGNAAASLPAATLGLIQKTGVAACDELDGVKDGIIGDPRACHFDPAALACRAEDGADCLGTGRSRRFARSMRALKTRAPATAPTPAGCAAARPGRADFRRTARAGAP
jgi:feruloyl esterase